jgi:hypothetical protein
MDREAGPCSKAKHLLQKILQTKLHIGMDDKSKATTAPTF